MGPPHNLVQGSGSMASTSTSTFNAQHTHTAATPTHSESTSYFGPGAGLARLHQYSEALKEGPGRQTLEYWRSFVDEFYLPQSTMHLVLWNPTTREQKGFEIPSSVVARWMHTNYISGVTSSSLSLESPREYLSGQPFPPPPRSVRADFHLPTGSVTHFVECKQSLYINHFENGWQVQMTGLLRVALVPHTRVLPSSSTFTKEDSPMLQTHLRFECLEYLVSEHQSVLPCTAGTYKLQEERIPKNVIRDILVAHGHRMSNSKKEDGGGGGGGGGTTKNAEKEDNPMGEEEEKSEFSINVNHLCLPESPVNEYGITLRAMRCLEITESVCQLRDLMDFSMREKEKLLGPIEGLRRLTSHYRDRDSHVSGQGATPTPNFPSDVNSSLPHMILEDQIAKVNLVKGQQSTDGNPPAAGADTSIQNSSGNGRLSTAPSPSPKIDASPGKRQR
ncbi:hypothetical protein CBS101457_003398 [Exobasidium rhododendri]|nr:hypothetical protein CBS101457_003398 [Exobasidium rhododendri]